MARLVDVQADQHCKSAISLGAFAGTASDPLNIIRKNEPSLDIQGRIDAAVSNRSGGGVVSVITDFLGGEVETEEDRSLNPDIPEGAKYEYLDHTADVQLHSWGEDLPEALSHLVVGF